MRIPATQGAAHRRLRQRSLNATVKDSLHAGCRAISPRASINNSNLASPSPPNGVYIHNHLYFKGGGGISKCTIYPCITDNTIINNNPEFEILEIYNLAAQSHVKISFDNPEYTSQVDGLGTLKILETIRSLSSNNFNKIKFYQASTSELFGDVLEIPQNEKTPFNPQSPYACAKLYSHYLVKNYREGYKLFACSGILFNHESPRRCDNFVTKKIINHVKEIKKLLINNEYDHRIKPLQLGNLNSKRDWGHAKDYVRAMWLMLQQEQAEDYVISMGETNSVREFIIKSFRLLRLFA